MEKNCTKCAMILSRGRDIEKENPSDFHTSKLSFVWTLQLDSGQHLLHLPSHTVVIGVTEKEMNCSK